MAGVRKYRKKPVEIHAFPWAPGCDLPGWAWSAIDSVTDADFVEIHTLEGTMKATPGDYIIRGVEGEVYPCKPSIFEKTYDPVLDAVEEEQDDRRGLDRYGLDDASIGD